MMRVVKTVEVKNDPRSYEQRLWDTYALCLVMPRHFPEYVDSADISATLRHLAATEVPPWQYTPDEEFLLAGEEP